MRASAPLRCRIDHSSTAEHLELTDPLGQFETDQHSVVSRVLREAEGAARDGHFVAGFVAYDAAPAFDPALRVQADRHVGAPVSPSLPLAWFGVFAGARPASPLAVVDEAGRDDTTGELWSSEIGEPAHATGVNSIRQVLADGNAYLVNYTTRLRRRWPAGDDPFELYRRLVTSYRGGYHAFIETDAWAVACGSPELFFELESDLVTTRPMKGTAARGRWSLEDADRARELRSSPKERAENVMVVDLLRNDLGRIAATGSVEVPVLWSLEQHPGCWQLTSTVTARRASKVGLAEVFGALFPCASVTGAPKVAAMSVIAGLERSARGVYCGAVGFLAPPSAGSGGRPHARFAVAIRTAVVDKERQVAEYGTGGGITWESSPRQEWAELELKARALTGPPAPGLGVGGGLIETMAFEPGRGGGSLRNLDGHLSRLTASARYFGLEVPAALDDAIAAAVSGLAARSRVRLLVRADGSVEIETTPLEHGTDSGIVRLCIDPEPVSSDDVLLFHKTTARDRYTERARRHPDADDVVLVNERGEVTESTRANLAAWIRGRWYTPPLDSGLLPGVERARLIAEGRLVERVVTAEQLRGASAVATLSSLRGWREARVAPYCRCRPAP